MASITATLGIADNMTAPMKSIINSANIMLATFEDIARSSDSTFDSTAFDGARNELIKAGVEMAKFGEEIDKTRQKQESFKDSASGDTFVKATTQATTSQQKLNNTILAGSNAVSKFLEAVGGYTILNKAISAITSSIDSAIARYDTLNNFPKVMQLMGYSAEEAEASINRLSDGITGLPTALDEIVSSTKLLVSATGDLNTATESALALNNAFYASGSSSADVSRGLTQYLQMLSAGKVDTMAWKTLTETMPYALNEVAEAFGYTGASAKQDLYNALSDGAITMSELNAKFIELSNAAGGFAEVALTSTGGIGTAWTNLQTAVTRGVTGIIEAIDSVLLNASLGGIAEIISGIATNVTTAFTRMKEIIISLSPVINIVIGLFRAVYNTIANNWDTIMMAAAVVTGFFAGKLLLAAGNMLLLAAKTLIANAPLVIMIALVFGAIKILQQMGVTVEDVAGVIGGLIGTMVAFIYNRFTDLWNFIAMFINFFGNAFKDPIGSIKVMFYELGEFIMSVIYDALSFVETLINKIPGVEVDITSGVGNFRDSLADAAQKAKDEMEWVEYVEQLDYVNYDDAFNTGSDMGKSIVNGLGDLLGGLDLDTSGLDSTLETSATGGGTEEDYLSNIDTNTSDIASAVSDSSDEELKYLKEIAERLALTNAAQPVTVNVDLSGMQNTVGSSTGDIDGFLNSLTTAVSDAVVSSAEGIHA